MERVLLAVDAGGTFFKYALVTENYKLIFEGECPAHSDGSLQDIEQAWRGLIREALAQNEKLGKVLSRMVISTPGPYDFANGCPLMKHKFTAAYGVSVLPWLHTELPDAPVSFLHDSTAFLLGQMHFGAAKDAKNPAAVTLGTGFGFGCAKDGRVLVNAAQSSYVSVWNKPFRTGITEDYVSRRAIRANYQALSGCEADDLPDVKEIAERAQAGETAAIETFKQMGEALGEILRPVLTSLNADKLVIGGQIAKAHALFLPYALPNISCAVAPAQGGTDTALLGAAIFCMLGTEKTICIEKNNEF